MRKLSFNTILKLDIHKFTRAIQYRTPTDKESIRRTINYLTIATTVAVAIILLSSYFFELEKTYIVLCLTVLLLFYGLLLVNKHIKGNWANYYGTIFLPLGINTIAIIVGGNFGENSAATAIIIFTYYLFENKPKERSLIIIYNIILHAFTITYISLYPPILDNVSNHIDDALVFVVVLGWIFLVLDQNAYSRNKLVNRLKAKNQDLIQTTEELERFTHVATHDLKSPLRTIISFSALLKAKIEQEEYDDIPSYLDYIRGAAKQMNILINDILQLSKISKNADIPIEEIDLNNILDKVLSSLQGEINAKNVKIESKPLPIYQGRPNEFILLFKNIIHNGIKYNDQEIPKIKIWHTTTNEKILIHFQDNGIGIDAKYFDYIFEYFKRLHTSDKYEGSGIGLGICQKLAEHYGGTMSVQSEVDKGSIFTLELPKVSEIH